MINVNYPPYALPERGQDMSSGEGEEGEEEEEGAGVGSRASGVPYGPIQAVEEKRPGF